MRFRLVDAAKKGFPVQRLCKVLGVSPSGYFAWKGRPACRRQREDMVLLAHVRSAFAASNEAVGRRRVARLMRENGMRARQKRRFRRADLPLKFHPAGIRASAGFTRCDTGEATCDRRSWSGLRSRSHVAERLAA